MASERESRAVRYREQAVLIRQHASMTVDEDMRREFLRIAEQYEAVAAMLRRRLDAGDS
jgi:hypothetical protein